jgi:drug/metabolite transporter (DMT)-like permease
MLESWVFWALLAASMQSVRTAGQKYLTGHISVYGATLVRYLFGLPFAIVYLSWLLNREGGGALPELGSVFLVSAAMAGLCQIVATILLIRLFSLRNFAVGSTYVRSEVLVTAIAGSVFFAEMISLLGWLAIGLSFCGLIIISLGNTGKLKSLWNKSAAYGLAAGVLFALTSLLIRRASLSLGLNGAMLPAAITLTFMVTLQTVITLVWVLVRDASEIKLIFQQWKPALFVGFTSVIGSAGWFTAFTLERAAYVKTLGQVEFLTTLAIAVFYFRERPSKPEMIGMLFIILGVVVLLLSS